MVATIGGTTINGTIVGGTIVGNPNGPGSDRTIIGDKNGPPSPGDDFGPTITLPKPGNKGEPGSPGLQPGHGPSLHSVIIPTSNPSPLPTVQQTRSPLPPPFAVSNPRSSTSDTPTSVSSSGIPGQQGLSLSLTSSPQNTATPIPNPVPGSAAPPSLSNSVTVKHGANSRIIAPVCIAILAILILSGVLCFKITRKRWPFTASHGKRVTLEPFHIKHGNQVAAPRNQPLSEDSGLGNSSRGSTGNTHQGHPLGAHQPRSSAEVPIPREQLVTYYATLMREVESIAQLLTVGTQLTQPTGQPQDDGPPAYSSQVEVAGTRPPGVTRERK